MTNLFLEADHEVKSGHARKIEDRIGGENGIIEAQDVEPDHQIGSAQVGHELVRIFFQINRIFTLIGVIKHGNGQAHLVNMAPTTDFCGNFLGFEVEVNNVGHATNGNRTKSKKGNRFSFGEFDLLILLPRRITTGYD